MTKLFVKIITGFRKDQEYTIPMEESPKAYYLFLNPEKRGVFSNGLALRGSDIQSIVPDYNATMGWNPTHTLDTDDWNQINSEGVGSKFKSLLAEAKRIALDEPQKINNPPSQVARLESKTNYRGEIGGKVEELRNKLLKAK